MRDYIEFDPAPVNENCVQVGSENYMERARKEGQRFIELLRKKFGPEPAGAYIKLKFVPHDFGSYAEVRVEYATQIGQAYAYCIESNLPLTWDDDNFVDYRD